MVIMARQGRRAGVRQLPFQGDDEMPTLEAQISKALRSEGWFLLPDTIGGYSCFYQPEPFAPGPMGPYFFLASNGELRWGRDFESSVNMEDHPYSENKRDRLIAKANLFLDI